MAKPASPETVERVRAYLDNALKRVGGVGFGSEICTRDVRLVDVELRGVELTGPGVDDFHAPAKGGYCRLTHEVVVSEAQCHRSKSQHGAATALLLDMLSSLPSLALSSKDRWRPYGGLTSNLTLDLLGPAPLGTTLKVVSETLNHTKQLAVMDFRMYDAKTGRLLARGTHTKVFGGNQASGKPPPGLARAKL